MTRASLPLIFGKQMKRALSAIVSIALVATQGLPITAQAAPVTCDASSADAGTDLKCGAVRIGGAVVTYPKLQWEKISEVPLTTEPGKTTLTGGDQALLLANRTALALNIAPADIANVNTTFPSNVPYVFGRYNPLDMTLRVDLFKLEKQTGPNGNVAHMFHAQFTPAHGDNWKASRGYLTPDAFKAGVTPGLNPFKAFEKVGSELFHDISGAGVQVVIGHAMRLAGAPMGMVAVSEPRFSQETKKSGTIFTKKVETWTYGHVKPRWWIAQPADVMARSTTAPFASFCANDPTLEDCPRYLTAVSGVAFEEFTGGTLNEEEEKWEVDYQKSSGLSFIGALVLGVLGSFAIAGLMAASGITLGATGATTAIGGAGTSTAMGGFGSFLVSNGFITGATSLGQAIAIEAAYVAASMAVVGGANLSSVIDSNPALLLGVVKVHKGKHDPQELNELQTKLNAEVNPRNITAFHDAAPGSATMLKGFSKTVLGDCAVGTKLADCTGGDSGMVLRVDQFSEQNRVTFTKDTGGNVKRQDDTTPAPF